MHAFAYDPDALRAFGGLLEQAGLPRLLSDVFNRAGKQRNARIGGSTAVHKRRSGGPRRAPTAAAAPGGNTAEGSGSGASYNSSEAEGVSDKEDGEDSASDEDSQTEGDECTSGTTGSVAPVDTSDASGSCEPAGARMSVDCAVAQPLDDVATEAHAESADNAVEACAMQHGGAAVGEGASLSTNETLSQGGDADNATVAHGAGVADAAFGQTHEHGHASLQPPSRVESAREDAVSPSSAPLADHLRQAGVKQLEAEPRGAAPALHEPPRWAAAQEDSGTSNEAGPQPDDDNVHHAAAAQCGAAVSAAGGDAAAAAASGACAGSEAGGGAVQFAHKIRQKSRSRALGTTRDDESLSTEARCSKRNVRILTEAAEAARAATNGAMHRKRDRDAA